MGILTARVVVGKVVTQRAMQQAVLIVSKHSHSDGRLQCFTAGWVRRVTRARQFPTSSYTAEVVEEGQARETKEVGECLGQGLGITFTPMDRIAGLGTRVDMATTHTMEGSVSLDSKAI